MRTLILALLLAAAAPAAVERHVVADLVDGTTFEHTLVYPAGGGDLPGLVMVPNWMGPTPGSLEKAEKIAALGYAVLMADVYGTGVRPQDAKEAAAAAGALRAGDRSQLVKRTARAVAVLRGLAKEHPVDAGRVAAIGFCFGGGAVLELARRGGDVAATVSFHGNLDTPEPAAEGAVTARLLVLHGADDPHVPVEQVVAFIQEMRAAGADWELVAYGGAVHSFTNPAADSPGQAQYHPRVARRSFAAMHAFLQEVFAGENKH